jgi:hypothetical protein
VTDPIPTTSRRFSPILFLLFLPFGFFVLTGDRPTALFHDTPAIDFGKHWDESLLLGDIKGSLQNRLLLPTSVCNYNQYPGLTGGNYEYPSLLYWIGLAVAVPEIGHGDLTNINASFVDEKIAGRDDQPNHYTIHVRQACLAISSLAILAVVWLGYLLARNAGSEVLPRPGPCALAALVAGCILATSWQFAYHARWIAPDEIMTVFSTACLALCVVAVQRKSTHAIVWAAVMAGLATGTKYPGGLLIVPLLTAGWMTKTRRWYFRLGRSLELLAILAVVLFVTTPGALAQPWNFIAWVKFDRLHYGTLGHYGHDIRNHTAMAMAMGEYLSLKLFSTVPGISIGIAALALVSAVAVCVRSWKIALVILPFPLLYFGYFSQQIVLIVRNLLVLAPIMAALAAVGTVVIADLFTRRIKFAGPVFGWGILVAVFSVIAWDAVWVDHASQSMQLRRTHEWQIAQLKTYADHHPELRIFPSETIARETGWPLVPSPKPGARDVAASFAMEDGDLWLWPANVPGLTLATFGADCVDFDSYPNWEDNRIVLLEIPQARRVPVGHIERIVRRRDLSNAVPDQKLLAYMGCGSAPQVDGNGIRIRAIHGTGYPCQFDVAVPQPDARAILADNEFVACEITGLDPKKTYSVGWSWWDWNTAHRFESAWAVAGTGPLSSDPSADWFRLCEPTRVPAWPLIVNPTKHRLSPIWPPPYPPRPGVATHADYSVLLPPAAYRDGRFRFVVKKESGPDVVLTGLWITTDLHR